MDFMDIRVYLSFLLATILLPSTASGVEVQTLNAQTPIQQLQQRSRGTTVSGRVVRIVGNDFILEDNTGQIIVDAGPRWWKEVNLQPGEQVSVRGEIGKGGELDAFEITRGDGSVIDIRPDNGPPPWAGGAKGKSAQPKPKP